MLSEGLRLRLFRWRASPGPFAYFATILVRFSKVVPKFAPKTHPKLRPKFHANSPEISPEICPEVFKLVFKGFEAPENCPPQTPPQIHTKRLPISPTKTAGAAQGLAPLFPACARGMSSFAQGANPGQLASAC